MGEPVSGDIRFRNLGAPADRGVDGLVVEIGEHFLIAQVGCFLEHQLAGAKDSVVNRQDDLSYSPVFVLHMEAVLAMPDARQHPDISQFEDEILVHDTKPFGERAARTQSKLLRVDEGP